MIGIFDSGVGGMTVARAIENSCPGFPFIYLGDIARTPYGTKSPDTIHAYSRRNIDFLIARGASLIVIACNSAASAAADRLRSQYRQQVVDVIGPATSKAASLSKSARIGVIGTSATVQTSVYSDYIRAIRPESKVFSQACPLLVPLVEEGWLNKRETKMIVKKYLQPLRCRQIDTLVLGCTHYPLLKPIIQPRIGKKVQLIDSSTEVALYLKKLLDRDPHLHALLHKPKQLSRFFVSDATATVHSLANTIFGRPVHLEKIDV